MKYGRKSVLIAENRIFRPNGILFESHKGLQKQNVLFSKEKKRKKAFQDYKAVLSKTKDFLLQSDVNVTSKCCGPTRLLPF